MKVNRIDRIYDPNSNKCVTGYSHGANPVPVRIDNNIYRIFFNVRDIKNQSCITFLDYDIRRHTVISISDNILIFPGDRGLFDDSGCSLGCILPSEEVDTYHIYYLGWSLRKTVPWNNFIGLALYDARTNSCRKLFKTPIIDRCECDPYTISYPFILSESGKYKMWYGSHVAWTKADHEMNHVIKYAESNDSIHWQRDGIICIKGDNDDEYAFSRPSVIYENGIYKMWYSYRGNKYRIGYAESDNGYVWIRKDLEMKFETSDTGWDSDMLDYPFVFRHNECLYMLYCGNGYGQTGFGIAEIVED